MAQMKQTNPNEDAITKLTQKLRKFRASSEIQSEI